MSDFKPKHDVEEHWLEFVRSRREAGLPVPDKYSAWSFGDSSETADSLGQLVLRRVKTATASLVWVYEAEDERLPQIGDYSIFLDGGGGPLGVIETVAVEIVPFDQVGPEHAYLEGEGDRSLEHWRKGHWRFFGRECAALGLEPDPTMPVVCERFQLLFSAHDERQ